MGKLYFVELSTGMKHLLTDDHAPRTIGRSETCHYTILEDICAEGLSPEVGISAGMVSGTHASIRVEKGRDGGTVYVQDEKSRNGTKILRDGNLIDVFRPQQIFPGESLILGPSYGLRLEYDDSKKSDPVSLSDTHVADDE